MINNAKKISLRALIASLFIVAQLIVAGPGTPYCHAQDSEPEEFTIEEDQLLESEDETLELEDESLEDDELSLGEDPLVEESDDFSDSEEIEVTEEESWEPSIKLNQKIRASAGTVNLNRGFPLGNDPAKEKSQHSALRYDIDLNTNISDGWNFYVDLSYEYFNKYDSESEKGAGDYQFHIRNAWFGYREGAHTLKLGEQKFETGTMDVSPMDILNRENEEGSEEFGINESEAPLPAAFYQWKAAGHSLSLFWSPYYRPTLKEEETINNKKALGEEYDDPKKYRDRYGWQYGISMDNMDAKIGYFRWFDQEPESLYKVEIIPPASLTALPTQKTTSEEFPSETSFKTLEMDLSVASYVWRLEVVSFENKNVIHYNKPANSTTLLAEIKSVSVDQDVFATSIERKYDKFFIMPAYYFYSLKNVPKNTHIYEYENLETPETVSRNLNRQIVSLFFSYEFTDEFYMETTLSHSMPFTQNMFLQEWHWTPDEYNFTAKLKIQRSTTERVKMTDDILKHDKTFLTLEYPL